MAPMRITPPLLNAAGAIWPPVCATVVAMRFIARRVQGSRLGIDDWLVLPALVLLIGMSAAILRGVDLESVGYFNPAAKSSDLAFLASTYQHRITSQVFWAVELMLVLALGFVKLSFMFFYRRIFRPSDGKHFDRIMFSVVAIIVAWTISFFFAQMFACGIHFDYLWTTFPNERNRNRCIKTLKMQIGFAVSDFITDFIVLVFPLPFIWKLRLPRCRRLGVTGIFLLGVFAVATSIARMVVYVQAKEAGLSRGPNAVVSEELYSVAAIYIIIMEAGFALCAANLSILYGMFKANGMQKLKESIKPLFSLLKPSHAHSTASQRYRQRIGSQDTDPPIIKRSVGSKRGEVNVKLVALKEDRRVGSSKDVDRADNDMV